MTEVHWDLVISCAASCWFKVTMESVHHDACVTAVDTNILIVGFVVHKFWLNIYVRIFKQGRLNEIPENKFPSKITRYMVVRPCLPGWFPQP